MTIRIGIEGGRRAVLERATAIGAAILVSANSLWSDDAKKFRGWKAYAGHDVALDSGGFVAMKRYGGYRWTPPEYAELARAMGPTWWAQMDFCCEPEIAADRATVFRRIDRTVEYLHACQGAASTIGATLPMPVLQGWHPEDYCSGPIYDRGFEWPSLVGIGSVCRRHVGGPDGIMAVVGALHAKVPTHVKFHLFGVKSTALAKLREEFPDRVESVDSMAWAFSARVHAREAGLPCDGAVRARFMAEWLESQRDAVAAADTNPQLRFNI